MDDHLCVQHKNKSSLVGFLVILSDACRISLCSDLHAIVLCSLLKSLKSFESASTKRNTIFCLMICYDGQLGNFKHLLFETLTKILLL